MGENVRSIRPASETLAPVPAPRRLMRADETCRKAGFGKTSLYKLMETEGFPRPVQIGTSVRWVESEVDAWIEARIALRDGGTSGGTSDAEAA